MYEAVRCAGNDVSQVHIGHDSYEQFNETI